MTNKQIIIDGCDVSGCEFLDNVEYDKLCLMISHRNECQVNCSNKPNCYYKQLKRKEQECEALQMSENEAGKIIAELEAYKDINEDFKTAWEELKAENEELKEQNIKLQNRNQQLSGAITQNLIYIQKLEKIEPLAIGLKQTDYQHIRQVGEKILQIIRDEEYSELVDLYKAKEQECEELRNKLNSNIERMNEQNEKLHNENKELKSYIKEDLVPHTKTKLFKKY